jgi:hypothetical protein
VASCTAASKAPTALTATVVRIIGTDDMAWTTSAGDDSTDTVSNVPSVAEHVDRSNVPIGIRTDINAASILRLVCRAPTTHVVEETGGPFCSASGPP